MVMRIRGRWRRGPWPAVLAVAATALVLGVQAYSRADVSLSSHVTVVAGEEAATHSLLAVGTFAPDVPSEPLSLTTGTEGEDGGEDLPLTAFAALEPLPIGPLACGTVTNNTGHRIEELAVYGDDDAWGRVSVADEWLEPGASTDLLCDIDGLAPGSYRWQGEVFAAWAEGSARVRFEVVFEVPEALPVGGEEPPAGEGAVEPGDEPVEEPGVPGEPADPTESEKTDEPGGSTGLTEPGESPAEESRGEDQQRQESPHEPGGGPGGGTGETAGPGDGTGGTGEPGDGTEGLGEDPEQDPGESPVRGSGEDPVEPGEGGAGTGGPDTGRDPEQPGGGDAP